MTICSLLALVLFSFNFINKQQCEGVSISLFDSKTIKRAGQKLNFQLNKDIPNAVWNFGDGSEMQTGKAVSHTYFQVGTFTITVSYGSGCKIFETITIENILESEQAIENNQIAIMGQHEIPAGSPLVLLSNIDASNYDWYVKDHPDLGRAHEKQISFVFNMPGSYDVILRLNNDSTQIHIHEVLVTAPIVADILNEPVIEDPPVILTPAPTPTPIIKNEPEETEQKAVKTYISITNVEMKYLLNDVIEGKKKAADFDKYLCNGGNTKVVANGNATVFSELIIQLTDKKGILGIGGKRKIKSVKQSFDPSNGNCVLILSVKYR